MRPMNAISMVPTFTAMRIPTPAPEAAASITFAARFSSNSSESTATREGSVVGHSILPNSRPPGIAMNDAASRYSIFTPSPA